MNIMSKKEINSICGGITFKDLTKKVTEKAKETIKEIVNDATTTVAEAATQELIKQQQALLEKVL